MKGAIIETKPTNDIDNATADRIGELFVAANGVNDAINGLRNAFAALTDGDPDGARLTPALMAYGLTDAEVRVLYAFFARNVPYSAHAASKER
jgi:hypothetical protein